MEKGTWEVSQLSLLLTCVNVHVCFLCYYSNPYNITPIESREWAAHTTKQLQQQVQHLCLHRRRSDTVLSVNHPCFWKCSQPKHNDCSCSHKIQKMTWCMKKISGCRGTCLTPMSHCAGAVDSCFDQHRSLLFCQTCLRGTTKWQRFLFYPAVLWLSLKHLRQFTRIVSSVKDISESMSALWLCWHAIMNMLPFQFGQN